MTSRESELENRLVECERRLERYAQQIELLRLLVQRAQQGQSLLMQGKAVTS